MELKEYLDFRHALSEWGGPKDIRWIERFIEKLYIDYQTSYTQGKLDGIERGMYIANEYKKYGEIKK